MQYKMLSDHKCVVHISKSL